MRKLDTELRTPIIETAKRHIVGLLIIPLLYARYSYLLFFPILLLFKFHIYVISLLWVLYVIVFVFIMGNAGLMNNWTKLFQSLFDIEYRIKDNWREPIRIPWAEYHYPILQVREKYYKITVKTFGDKLYDSEESIRRKAIYYWFWG